MARPRTRDKYPYFLRLPNKCELTEDGQKFIPVEHTKVLWEFDAGLVRSEAPFKIRVRVCGKEKIIESKRHGVLAGGEVGESYE